MANVREMDPVWVEYKGYTMPGLVAKVDPHDGKIDAAACTTEMDGEGVWNEVKGLTYYKEARPGQTSVYATRADGPDALRQYIDSLKTTETTFEAPVDETTGEVGPSVPSGPQIPPGGPFPSAEGRPVVTDADEARDTNDDGVVSAKEDKKGDKQGLPR